MGSTCGACTSTQYDWACCSTTDDTNVDLNHGQVESGSAIALNAKARALK